MKLRQQQDTGLFPGPGPVETEEVMLELVTTTSKPWTQCVDLEQLEFLKVKSIPDIILFSPTVGSLFVDIH